MITEISWASYWTFVVISLTLYYLVILVLYYLEDIRNLFSGKVSFLTTNGHSIQTENMANVTDNPRLEEEKDEAFPDEFPEITELMEELRKVIRKAADAGFAREELLLALKLKIAPHRQYRNTVFLAAINELIIAETKNNCSIHLSIEEMNRVWKS